MIWDNIKMAMSTLMAYKTRSILTILGIVIGVFSIVLVVSLGEGLKNDIQNQVDEYSSNLIVLSTNRSIERDINGDIVKTNFFTTDKSPDFTEQQFNDIKKIDGVEAGAASMLIDSGATLINGSRSVENVTLAGATTNLPDVLSQSIVAGQFYSASSKSIVISQSLAKALFSEDAPLARTIQIKGIDLTVIGVVESTEIDIPGVGDTSNIAYVPIDVAESITGSDVAYDEIDLLVDSTFDIGAVSSDIRSKMVELRSAEDFSYLAGDETTEVINSTFDILTRFLSVIAAIIFLIGGVGIMNIMLTTVSEREHEIGIRKSIGAPRRSVLLQFLIEAVVLSVLGAIVGIILAYITGLIIVAYTDLSIGVSWMVIAFSLVSAILIGAMFGLAPALKASRKDPIAALRRQ